MSGKVTAQSVWREYETGVEFNERIGLYDTVRNNENFFVGKQWEGVRTNGLPTPVFNFLKRVVLFTIASLSSTQTKISAAETGALPSGCAAAVNSQLERLFESNRMGSLIREFLRNAAVDGDGCLFSYWDSDTESVATEVIENSRVFFGNVNDRRVERQPYIIIETREMLDSARARMRLAGADSQSLRPDASNRAASGELHQGDKVTALLRMWKNSDTGTIWCAESVRGAMLRAPWDTGLTRYPVVWLPWDFVQDSFHGQAMITGLIPNQIFINKLFAMSMIALMTTAHPKIVYDRSRIAKWDNRVGSAIGISGGDVAGAAKIIEPAHISPQIAQFIEMSVSHTQTFLGATPAALGDVRPDNTSAIIALQKASSVPNELTRQSLYQAIEDLGRIYVDFMRAYYGARTENGVSFDFSLLDCSGLSLRLDVGASSYWSEIASMQTLDNLLVRGKISFEDYLKRVPDGYIPEKEALLERVTEINGSVK
ncbi:MAG: hypothetical protein LBC78_05000 [Oscillospiraceae bacterium]|jgi:hypothetical protein|nr:hypothetical protein [Oscillospiraceae bacterium]